jgi:hypothetical protein
MAAMPGRKKVVTAELEKLIGQKITQDRLAEAKAKVAAR